MLETEKKKAFGQGGEKTNDGKGREDCFECVSSSTAKEIQKYIDR